jgi:hypothetical protein
MNAYFFKMTNEERDNILDQHKEIYDGYVTSYAQQPKEQPLYTQDLANDKQGLTVNNKGEVTAYKNMNINEMRFDNKSTGLFGDEENGFKETMEQGHISGGSIYEPEESFESEMDEEYYVSLGEKLDMVGDGNDDLEHGVFGHNDEDELPFDIGDDSELFNDDDEELNFELNIDDLMGLNNDEDEIDDEEVEGLFDDLKESLEMFKRFTKYN